MPGEGRRCISSSIGRHDVRRLTTTVQDVSESAARVVVQSGHVVDSGDSVSIVGLVGNRQPSLPECPAAGTNPPAAILLWRFRPFLLSLTTEGEQAELLGNEPALSLDHRMVQQPGIISVHASIASQAARCTAFLNQRCLGSDVMSASGRLSFALRPASPRHHGTAVECRACVFLAGQAGTRMLYLLRLIAVRSSACAPPLARYGTNVSVSLTRSFPAVPIDRADGGLLVLHILPN